MSIVIRVELPTYSHSFQVSVPSTGTVSDVKQEIEKDCPGNPRAHGQRLIWRGRFLGDDEKVLNIWKVCPSSSCSLSIVLCVKQFFDGQVAE
jgi:Ubiquitin family